MDQNEEFLRIARPFAEAISPLAAALRALPAGPSRERKGLAEAIDQVVRKCHDAVLLGVRPVSASTRAQSVAAELMLDLASMAWGEEPRESDQRTKRLYLEHVTPISVMRQMFVTDPSRKSVLEVVATHLHAVWITPDEQQRLDSKHRSDRPDPKAAFEAVDITVDLWPLEQF